MGFSPFPDHFANGSTTWENASILDCPFVLLLLQLQFLLSLGWCARTRTHKTVLNQTSP